MTYVEVKTEQGSSHGKQPVVSDCLYLGPPPLPPRVYVSHPQLSCMLFALGFGGAPEPSQHGVYSGAQ